MFDGRRVPLAPLRLRTAVAPGDAAGSGSGLRGGGLYAPGRPGHRPGAEDQGLQTPGAGLRHSGGQPEAWLRYGLARVRPRSADFDRPRPEDDPPVDEQPAQDRGAGTLRTGNRRAVADQGETEPAQRPLSQDEAGETGASALGRMDCWISGLMEWCNRMLK